MSIISDILTGKIRQEMRERVNEILAYGREWVQTAQKLTEALNNLTEEIRKGNVDPKSLKAVGRATSRLAKETSRLAKAVENHSSTLQKALAHLG